MQEVPPSDRADLALGKESCRGNGSEPSLHGSNIVVGSTEEPLTAPATTEQKGPKRGMPVRRSIRRQEEVQVIACRLCVTKVELDSLALLHNVSNRDGSGLLIRSDEIPNKEVAPLEMAPLLLDRNAKMQCPMRIATVGPFQRFKDILEPGQGRNAAEFIDEVLLSPGDHKSFADRSTALRGDGSDRDRSCELHANHASVKALLIEEQSILPRILSSTSEPPADYAPRVPVGHEGQDFLHRG